MRRRVLWSGRLVAAALLAAGCVASGDSPPGSTSTLVPGGGSAVTTLVPDACVQSYLDDADPAPPAGRGVQGNQYGAGAAGPDLSTPASDGLIVTPATLRGQLRRAEEGQVLRLRSGCYPGFTVPAGVTVAPFAGEAVVIEGQLTLRSGSTIEGLIIRSEDQWAVRVHNSGPDPISDVVIRNNDISGGSIEAVRISGNVLAVLIEGNLISRGGNHGIKIHGDDTGYEPGARIIGNVISQTMREDSIQVEEAGDVLIMNNSLSGAPEDNLDVKSGRVEVAGNLFISAGEGSILVHGSGVAAARGNLFLQGGLVAVGSRDGSEASLLLEGNLLQAADIVLRQTTQPIVVRENTLEGGVVTLGFSDGDFPEDVLFASNVIVGTVLVDNIVPQGGFWRCEANAMSGAGSGWPSGCG